MKRQPSFSCLLLRSVSTHPPSCFVNARCFSIHYMLHFVHRVLLHVLQHHLKNVLQTLIAHVSTWRTRKNGNFQHSFGASASGCGLRQSQAANREGTVSEFRYEGDRREAASAMLAAQSTLSPDEGQPISLFHFRDALTVSYNNTNHFVFSVIFALKLFNSGLLCSFIEQLK